MSIEANKALVRRYYEEIVNGGNATLVDTFFAPDYVNHVLGSPDFRSPEGEKQFDSLYRQAFPDANLTVEDMVAEEDKVVSRLTYRGTHIGAFQGIPPTGRQFITSGVQEVRIANGKIAEAWSMPDSLGLLQQLGVIPALGQAS